jgi:hypothetical protein
MSQQLTPLSGDLVLAQPQESGILLPNQSVFPYHLHPSDYLYAAVVGQPSDVTAGKATYSSLQAAVTAVPTNSAILLLPGTIVENVTITGKTISIIGRGHMSILQGSITLTTSSLCLIRSMKFGISGASLIFGAGSNKNWCTDCWFPTGGTISNSGTDNYWMIITE